VASVGDPAGDREVAVLRGTVISQTIMFRSRRGRRHVEALQTMLRGRQPAARVGKPRSAAMAGSCWNREGRIEAVSLCPGERFLAHGKSVIARSREVGYRVAPPTKSLCRPIFPRRAIAGPTMGPDGAGWPVRPIGSSLCCGRKAATGPAANAERAACRAGRWGIPMGSNGVAFLTGVASLVTGPIPRAPSAHIALENPLSCRFRRPARNCQAPAHL